MNSTPKHFEIDMPDLTGGSEAWLFYERDERGRVRLQPRFRHLACKKCGRIDEHAALNQSGLSLATPIGAKSRDVWRTKDSRLIVSPKCRDALQPIRSLLEFIDLEGEGGWTTVWPKIVIEPPPAAPVYHPLEFARPGDPFQVRRGRCNACNRFLETTWTPMYYHVPSNVEFAGVRLEKLDLALMSYIASREVVELIKKNDLRGVKVVRERFASDTP